MTSASNAIERSARVYRWLLRCYPEAFRHDFGDEMELVFRELATDAWAERGRRGLASVWVRVFIDFARSVPYQYYLARTAEGDMTYPRAKTIALAAVSLATAVALNFVVFAALAIGIHALSLTGFDTSFRNSTSMDLYFMLLCPVITGFVACRVTPFFRPYWTAPLGPMLLVVLVGLMDTRAPWYGVLGCLCIVGAATLVGCYLSTRLRWRTATGPAA